MTCSFVAWCGVSLDGTPGHTAPAGRPAFLEPCRFTRPRLIPAGPTRSARPRANKNKGRPRGAGRPSALNALLSPRSGRIAGPPLPFPPSLPPSVGGVPQGSTRSPTLLPAPRGMFPTIGHPPRRPARPAPRQLQLITARLANSERCWRESNLNRRRVCGGIAQHTALWSAAATAAGPPAYRAADRLTSPTAENECSRWNVAAPLQPLRRINACIHDMAVLYLIGLCPGVHT